MQQSEIFELFRPILQQNAQRRRFTDYGVALLILIILALVGIGYVRNDQVPKIESITLVPGSVVVFGPADGVAPNGRLQFCPGDTMTVRYDLVIEGEGAIYADDVAHYQNTTVKFSEIWRDVVKAGTRTYDNEWRIPAQPDMAIDGAQGAPREWVPGNYTRVISVAPSNLYISRYVPPATFEVAFTIAEGCGG